MLSSNRRWLFFLILGLILSIAGGVRSYDLNWDEDTHLHPDERYLTMVASALQLPALPGEYWDTSLSPLNPENRGYAGYVYGTLPLFAARVVGEWLDKGCGETPVISAVLARQMFLGGWTSCTPGDYTGYGGIHFVGRALSMFADLLTLLALALLTRLLCGDRAALLAAGLYALAVLPIQHAHFFVVDSFATVFVIWTLFFVVSTVESGRREWLIPAGLMTGLAVASKISTWPIAGMVALAAILHKDPTMDENNAARYTFRLAWRPLIFLGVAGALAAVTFRVAQPYAFAGPGFFDVAPNPAWLETMRYIRNLVSGEVDVPYGHQWANRLPIVFPWINMVFWGLGLPLGLAAWVGWGALSWRIFKRMEWKLLLLWLWGTLFFLYQGTQWVKSMRYLLPVYPVFVFFAAWGLNSLVTWGNKQRRIFALLAKALPILVLVGAALWAWAFLQIYTRPFTRVEASRWMYHNVPAAATLRTDAGLNIQAPIMPGSALVSGEAGASAEFSLQTGGTLAQATLNKVTSGEFDGERRFRVRLNADPTGAAPLTQAEQAVVLPANTITAVTIALPSVSLQAGDKVYLSVELISGPPVTLGTSIIGNEHWDDGLPVRLDGKDAFYNWYRGLSSSGSGQMNLYDDDNLIKREQLLDWLDEVDYIALSSNRLYGSIARLPLRYPLTVAYYRALFDGSLGFALQAEFVSFPSLGSCQFPDQETPFPLMSARYTNRLPCSLPFPAAEEAFSVYDHPQVLIFAKTPAYSRAAAATLLTPALAESAQWMTPRQATTLRWKNAAEPPLVMSSRMRLTQQNGGTWSELFNWNALQNRYPVLAVALWWLALAALGWMAFPWLMLAFPALHDRGYGLARMSGLLLWAYPAWLLASLHWVTHTRLLLWAVFLAWCVATAFLVRARKEILREFLCARWQDLLRIEVIFTVLFLFWVGIRYLNPDLYHPVSGGEKPMDFAYLNAVIRSSWFPPYDPWFTGGYMNYYYFGFVLVGSLVKAVGIAPAIAYNLIIPSLFAMTGAGAYTLAANLSGGGISRMRRAGLWGVLLTVVLGNLGELQLILKGLAEVGQVSFDSLIPGYELLVSATVGFWKVVVKGQTLPFRPEWWYWNATRVIQAGPGEAAGPINEFPMFTSLYADLHAHAIAYPLTQVALGVGLQWAIQSFKPLPITALDWRQRIEQWLPRPLPAFILGALTLGALRATNTWDYPTYLLLLGISFLLPALRTLLRPSEDDEPATLNFIYPLLLTLPLLFLLAELFFWPYTANYAVVYSSFEMWKGDKTSAGEYFIVHGQFLLPIVLLGVAQGWQLLRRLWLDEDNPAAQSALLSLAVAAAGALLVALTLAAFKVAIAWIVLPMGLLATVLFLDSRQSPRFQTLWFWVGTALAITLFVEVIVLKGDLGRMNTVFKLYLQVWLLLASSAAVALERLMSYLWSNRDDPHIRLAEIFSSQRYVLGDIVLGVLGMILFATALYPLFAIPAKVRDRWSQEAPRTLNGQAYMDYGVLYEQGNPLSTAADAKVIRWLQENVAGSPAIMEANAEVEYVTWGNRISINTGLPGVIGWRWHQVQQRMVMPGGTVERRQFDVRDFYNTTDITLAREILARYDVRYVVYAPYERMVMLSEGWPKFSEMVERQMLEVVYQDVDSVIYRVLW